jgi:hypothetical protein
VDTVKVCAPDGAARQVEVGGARYASRDGLYEMRPDHARMLRAAGGFVPALNGAVPRTAGYRCPDCKFGSLFTTCGRCGAACTKEQ